MNPFSISLRCLWGTTIHTNVCDRTCLSGDRSPPFYVSNAIVIEHTRVRNLESHLSMEMLAFASSCIRVRPLFFYSDHIRDLIGTHITHHSARNTRFTHHTHTHTHVSVSLTSHTLLHVEPKIITFAFEHPISLVFLHNTDHSFSRMISFRSINGRSHCVRRLRRGRRR